MVAEGLREENAGLKVSYFRENLEVLTELEDVY